VNETLQHLAATVWKGVGHTFCCISTLQEGGGELRVQALHCAGSDRASWPALRGEVFPARVLPDTPTLFSWSDDAARPVVEGFAARLGLGHKRLQWLMVAPIKRAGRTVAVLDVGEMRRHQRGAFDSRTLELVNALMNEISLAVALADSSVEEGAPLLRMIAAQAELTCESVTRSELLTKLEQELRELRSSATPRNLFHTIARAAASLLDCDKALFLTHLPAFRQLEVNALIGLPEDSVREIEVLSPEFKSRFFATGAQPRVARAVDVLGQSRAGLVRGQALVVPIKAEGRIEHLIVLGEPRNRAFGRLEEEVMARFAHHASQSLDTSRLVNPQLLDITAQRILQKVGDYIQSTAEEKKILHAMLTGVTAGYGLGFNRAAIFLLDQRGTFLQGELGIGQMDTDAARRAWQKDQYGKLEDFQDYLQRLERDELSSEDMNEQVLPLRLPVDRQGDDIISRALRERVSILRPRDGTLRLPDELSHIFPHGSELAVVPLVAQQRALGVVICDNKHTQRRIFTEDLESLNLFCRTGAIAIANRRRQRALFLASATAISSSEKDPLKALLQQTLNAAQASSVTLVKVLHGDRFRLVGSASLNGSSVAGHVIPVRDKGISRWVMTMRLPYVIEDVSKTEQDEVNPILAELGVQAAVCLPWMLGDTMLGVMWLHYDRPTKFSKQQVADLQTFVYYVAGIWNDREKMRRLEHIQETFAEIMNATTRGDQVLSAIVQGTRSVMGCDTVTLYMHNDSAGTLECPESQMAGVKHAGPATRRGAADKDHFIYALYQRADPYVARDAQTDRYFKDSRFTREEDIHSVVAVPLIGRDSKHVGILFVSYVTPNALPEEELGHIQLFARYAVVAIQNAKLFAAHQQQLREQHGLAELSQTLLGSVTADKIINSAVEAAQRLLRTDLACMVLLDSVGQIEVRAAVGWTETQKSQLLPVGAASHAGYTISEKIPVVVEYFDQETRFTAPLYAEQGTVSGLSVPMWQDSRIIGALLVHTRRHFVFDDTHIRFLSLIANQVAVAIATAAQADTIARQTGRQDALQMVTKAIHASHTGSPDSVLETILQQAVDSLSARKHEQMLLGTLQLYDEEQKCLVFKFFSPRHLKDDEAARRGQRMPMPGGIWGSDGKMRVGITGRAYLQGRPQLVGDVLSHPDYLQFNDKIRSELAVPMLDGLEVLGVINVESSLPNAFDSEDQKTLVTLARLAVVALRNFRRLKNLRYFSHEVRQPIATIKMDAERLRSAQQAGRVLPVESQRDCIERIYYEVRRLHRIYTNILSLTFLTQGVTEYKFECCQLVGLVRDEARSLGWEADRKRIQLELPKSAEIEVWIDAAKIRQVVSNLVFNAIKFASSRVEVEVSLEGDHVAIVVKDDGIGIEAKDHAVIFQPFRRVIDVGVEGSGLGLAITKDYVAGHRGTIDVESKPKLGAAFRVRLPIAPQPGGQA